MTKVTTISKSQTVDPFALHGQFLDSMKKPMEETCNICGAKYTGVCTNCDHVKVDADEQAERDAVDQETVDAYWYSRLKNED